MNGSRLYIIRGIMLILLAAILQTYVCSALCSIENSCISISKPIEKDCCHHDENGQKEGSDDGDCQKDHMAFLQTIGQFHSYDAVIITKVFQQVDIINVHTDLFTYLPSDSKIFAFTGFRPPPPKDGIPVIVQSFLI